MDRGIALVRTPSSRLAQGIVTHIPRTPVDGNLARRQHDAYCAALDEAGWSVRDVVPADGSPDSVFVEDTVVVCGSKAILTRPGAPQRRPEVAGTESAVRALGLDVTRIESPGTLEGGDVLQIGDTVYVGRGGRTNADAIRQLRRLLPDRNVVAVPLGPVLHLKSAATALPDGTVLARRELVDTAVFSAVRTPDEESGCHVVPLGGERVLIAASAPKTAHMLADLGFTPVVVDVSEFEKLEGCVTCLSVLIPTAPTS
ncbi:dimethylargininase [Phytohabitans aurantiacus]|jgi:dimethylargininase|uniref:N(G),N(G)-dimethylarginine dimethylaminohydrolase n=1 Tax=Phytohabitans aurantiacus TaxID=3016789 RepID=A0ABQ5R886_9ACTN|nr:dimethylargininase [Phytohabitans aurantiacus]GLI02974.1 N(G),N(G)-dimethylarginine dimethylaminohydrolase [Phytohabitans aurantiacus]